MYDKLGEPGLSRKHFAIAKVKRMRDLNIIPPKSSIPKNYRTTPIEYKVEIIDFRNVQNTKDVGLNADNADLMYFEFIDILIENVLFDIADSTL